MRRGRPYLEKRKLSIGALGVGESKSKISSKYIYKQVRFFQLLIIIILLLLLYINTSITLQSKNHS